MIAPEPASRSACGLLRFDLGECVFGWVPDWVWTVIEWWPWILGGIAALAVLGVLYRIKVTFGWPGLATVLGLGIFAGGYVLGRRSADPIENVDEESSDAAPPVARKPRSVVKRDRRYNPDSGNFEDV